MSFTGKPEAYLESTLENDGFFPDISLGEFQRLYRVPAEYLQELVEHHLRLAISDCNDALAEQQTIWIKHGAEQLEDVSDRAIGGKKVLVMQYNRAVYARAMGLLVRAYTSLNRKAEAEQLAKEGVDVTQDYFAQSKHALRRLRGVGENITVELI